MDMTLKIPPGVARGASPAEVPGRWYETHMVRWVGGVLRPCLGMERVVSDLIPDDGFYALADNDGDVLTDSDGDVLGYNVASGKIRAIHTWVDNTGIQRTGVLCDDRLMVYEGDNYVDITPTGGMDGPANNLLAGGYGDGNYGVGEYGTPRPEREMLKAIGPAYSIDNWGENLVAMTSYDGRLLMWEPNIPGNKAEAVAGAPVANRSFVITDQRHVALFGMGGDARRWGWCSQEDINDWDFASITNTAGEYFIEPSAPIVGAEAYKNIILIHTAKRSFVSPYLGTPYIYGQDGIGDNLAPLSAGSLVKFPDGIMWISDGQVWMHDGSSISPVKCELIDWFTENRSKVYTRYRMSGHALGSSPEIWWHFPVVGSTENDRYISYNYVDAVWSMGFMKRTCGAPSSFISYPMMSDGRALFLHEKGNYYPDVPLPYAETASINVEAGSSTSTIRQCIPDHGSAHNNVQYTFFGRFNRVPPNSADEFVTGPLTTREDGYLDVGQKARDHRMRIQLAADGGLSFTFGEMLIDVVKGSKR